MTIASDATDGIVISDAAVDAVLERIVSGGRLDLNAEQVEKVRSNVKSTFRVMEVLQRTPLTNADEPYFVFRAHSGKE